MNVSSFLGFINPLCCLLQVLITPSLHRRQTDKIINECKVPRTSTHKRKKREKKRASHKETGGGYKREREGGVSASQSQLYVRTSTTVCSQTHTLQLSGTKKKKQAQTWNLRDATANEPGVPEQSQGPPPTPTHPCAHQCHQQSATCPSLSPSLYVIIPHMCMGVHPPRPQRPWPPTFSCQTSSIQSS